MEASANEMQRTEILPQRNEPDKCAISVIMPVFNEEAYIKDSLGSILESRRQSLPDGFTFEVILIDDGSTDDTLKIVEDSFGRDDRLKVLCGMKKGVSAARNQGMDLAKGEYLVFCDADDRLEEGALSALFACTREEPCDLVIGRMRSFSGFGSNVMQATDRLAKKKDISRDDPLLYRTMMVSGKLYRRRFVEENKIRFLPIAYAEDAAFYMDCVMAADKIKGCCPPNVKNPVIYNYRRRSFWENSSVTQRFDYKLWLDFMESNHYLEKRLEPMGEDYLTGFRARVVENIIRAFYKNYWMCTPKMRENMTETLKEYRERMPESLWTDTVCTQKSDRYLGLTQKEGPFRPYGISDSVRRYAVIIFLERNLNAREIEWVLNSIYHQDFPSFALVIGCSRYEELPPIYQNMDNLFCVTDDRQEDSDLIRPDGSLTVIGIHPGYSPEEIDIRGNYAISMRCPLGIQNSALTRLVNLQERHDRLSVVFANVLDTEMANVSLRLRNKYRYYRMKYAGHYIDELILCSDKKWKYSESLWKMNKFIPQRSGHPSLLATCLQDKKAVFVLYPEEKER